MTGFQQINAYWTDDGVIPTTLQPVALVQLDHGVWSKERHFFVSVIVVHPDNLDTDIT